MRKFFSIFVFYRPLIIWSFFINMLLCFLELKIFSILIVKFVLLIALWHLMHETFLRRKLKFYNKLGFSTIKLFGSIFLIDICMSIPFSLLLLEYV